MDLFDPIAAFKNWIASFAGFFTDARALFWWPTLVVAGAAALIFAAISARKSASSLSTERKSFKAFLRELPMDVACYLGYTFTQVFMAKSLFWATVGGISAVFLIAGQPARMASAAFGEQLAIAALAFALSDFCLYWSHRLFHWPRVLWWFHSLHHNPPVLTPITAFRFWPPEAACHFAAFNFGEGVALGIANLAFGASITPTTYLGVNVFWLSWYLAFSHLRHSHVALAYPRWLSHILVSPQMHQAHHSIDPRHHQRNFGTALALWDWAFGTLHIPAENEKYQFGVVRA
jgi:sterol desaturase/sphingolipid hydroxylase (fatty acid hydroxylase superfamily)